MCSLTSSNGNWDLQAFGAFGRTHWQVVSSWFKYSTLWLFNFAMEMIFPFKMVIFHGYV
jgi:hypothetical protein